MRAIPCPAMASYSSLRLPRQGRSEPRTAAAAPSCLAATALHQCEARRRANFELPSSRHRPDVGDEKREVLETEGSYLRLKRSRSITEARVRSYATCCQHCSTPADLSARCQ